MTAPASRAPRPLPDASVVHRLTFWRVMRSEWIKLSSLRSNWVTAIILFAELIGMPLLIAFAYTVLAQDAAGQSAPAAQLGTAPLVSSGQSFGLLIAAVLSILAIGGEFGTGSIRASLTAVPRRGTLLGAKVLVSALAVGVVTLLGFAVALPAAAAPAGVAGGQVDVDLLADDGLAKAGLCILSIMLFAVFAFGVALLVHSTAGAITIVVVILYVLPLALQIVSAWFSSEWIDQVIAYLPSSLASSMVSWPTDPSQPAWWGAALALLAWAIVPLAAGMALFRRRDA